MPEQLLRPSTPQEEPKPEAQGPPSEGMEQGGKSSIQRLKERLATSLQHQSRLQQERDLQQDRIDQLEQRLNEIERQKNPSGPEDYSIAELQGVAFSKDDEVDLTTRLRAFQQITQREKKDILNEVRGLIEETVGSKLTQRDHQSNFMQEYQALERRFGRENLQPGSDLHDLASRYYNFYRRDVGNASEQVPVQNMLKLRAVEAAANALGLQGKPGLPQAPEDNIEGGSTGGTGPATGEESFLKEYNGLLEKGDRKGALALKLKRYVYGE